MLDAAVPVPHIGCTNLVEVDVHALKLEIGSSIVAGSCQFKLSIHILMIIVLTLRIHQGRARQRWFAYKSVSRGSCCAGLGSRRWSYTPEGSTDLVTLKNQVSYIVNRYALDRDSYALSGLEMNLYHRKHELANVFSLVAVQCGAAFRSNNASLP